MLFQHKSWLICLMIGSVLGITTWSAGDAYAFTQHPSSIHWMDYSSKAFVRAKKEKKPVFMLLTAVWCYNCQIYEEKTLKKQPVVEFINKHFIPVFVDYDRRRDLAATYSSVGIPVTSIFAPNGEALVNAPGYIPPDTLLANLQKTLDYLAKDYEPSLPEVSGPERRPLIHPKKKLLEEYVHQFASQMSTGLDPAYGGFGINQKEPHAGILLRLLELKEQGAKGWTEPLQITLDAMLGLSQKSKEGEKLSFEKLRALRSDQAKLLSEVEALQTQDMISGIYDPVEGGFFRYDTRRNWTVPHFEKMLFENSQLIDMFLKAHTLYKKTVYRDAAIHSLNYIQRVLFNPNEGRFYGSQLADEVYYHFTASQREKAGMPPVDQTSYAVSSAKAIITFLNAAKILHDPAYQHTAIQVLGFLEHKMTGKNGVFSYYDPQKKKGVLSGRLEDNAWIAAAFLSAYDRTGNKKYLELTKQLAQFVAKNLYDSVSGGFFERRSASGEMYRTDELFDKTKDFANNGIMAAVLLGLYDQTKDPSWFSMLEGTVSYFLADIDAGGLKADSPEFHRVVQRLIVLKK